MRCCTHTLWRGFTPVHIMLNSQPLTRDVLSIVDQFGVHRLWWDSAILIGCVGSIPGNAGYSLRLLLLMFFVFCVFCVFCVFLFLMNLGSKYWRLKSSNRRDISCALLYAGRLGVLMNEYQIFNSYLLYNVLNDLLMLSVFSYWSWVIGSE